MSDLVRRYQGLLEEVFQRTGVQKRPLERKLGWSRGAVTKLCSGENDLKVGKLLRILDALGVNPLDFYALAHAEPAAERPLWERILTSLDGQGSVRATLSIPESMSRQELEAMIEKTVRAILEEREAGEKA